MRRSFATHLLAIFFILLLASLACSTLVRTAEPEYNYRYDNLPEAGDEDASISKYRAISQWGKTDITYYYINSTEKIGGNAEQDLVNAAFALWADQTPLTFNEVSDPAQADILIGWAQGEHGDGDPFDGPGDVLAHASFPNPYNDRTVFLHFDDSERWVNSETRDVDLLTVAAHEIGHNLGLDHSSDPNALMYAAYTGPHRFLDEDDIAGVQSIYGLAAEPAEGPEAPAPGETPPASAGQDTDKDGISDEDEILRTGTDPKKADTDGDGLGDGVEVSNRMNPLDPDMDRDGVSDGQEVAQGTNPFLPDQNVNISPELSREVSEFLTEAIELQIKAYQNGDASIAATILTGDLLATMEDEIAALNQQGLVQISEIDYYQSYIDEIRVLSNTQLEVDSCEVWTTNTYRRSDGALIQSTEARLLPQTITIQKFNSGWFITKVNFLNAPAFCDQ